MGTGATKRAKSEKPTAPRARFREELWRDLDKNLFPGREIITCIPGASVCTEQGNTRRAANWEMTNSSPLMIKLEQIFETVDRCSSSHHACTKLHSAGFSFTNHSEYISSIIPCPLCGHSPNSSTTNPRRCLRCPSLVTRCCFGHFSSGLCLTLRSRTQACAEYGKPHHTS